MRGQSVMAVLSARWHDLRENPEVQVIHRRMPLPASAHNAEIERSGGARNFLKATRDLPSSCHVETAEVARIEAGVGQGGPPLAQLVRFAIGQLRQWFPTRVVAVYVERQFDEPATAEISPSAAALPADEYSLPLRFASWLTVLDVARIQSVPKYLSPWLPAAKVLVVPLVVDGCHRGAIVVDAATLSRVEVRQTEELAQRLSVTLGDFEHRSPQGVNSVRDRFAYSVRRIKVATQV